MSKVSFVAQRTYCDLLPPHCSNICPFIFLYHIFARQSKLFSLFFLSLPESSHFILLLVFYNASCSILVAFLITYISFFLVLILFFFLLAISFRHVSFYQRPLLLFPPSFPSRLLVLLFLLLILYPGAHDYSSFSPVHHSCSLFFLLPPSTSIFSFLAPFTLPLLLLLPLLWSAPYCVYSPGAKGTSPDWISPLIGNEIKRSKPTMKLLLLLLCWTLVRVFLLIFVSIFVFEM